MNHMFDIAIAAKHGVNNAIFLHNVSFWTHLNEANQNNLFDGRYWTYNTQEAFTKLFPYWSRQNVRTIITSCLDSGLLLTGNYNKKGYDKTTWYALSDEGLALYNMTAPSHADEIKTNEALEPAPSLIGCNQPIDWLEPTKPLVRINQAIPDSYPDSKKDICVTKPQTNIIGFTEYKALELTGLSTMVQQEKIDALKLACLSHDKCQQEFDRILGAYDVTLEEVLEDCVSHYGLKDDAQYVSPQRFLTWIRRTNAEQKGYMSKKQVKANAAVARQTEFNDEEKELLQDLRYQRKNPDLPPKLKGGELRKAEDLMLIADSLAQQSNVTKKTIVGRPVSLASMLTRFTERVGIK